MAGADSRVTMDNIIRDVIEAGTSNLKSPDAENPAFNFSVSDEHKPIALQRVVDVLVTDPEYKVSIESDSKFVLQRGYGTTSFIYLATCQK